MAGVGPESKEGMERLEAYGELQINLKVQLTLRIRQPCPYCAARQTRAYQKVSPLVTSTLNDCIMNWQCPQGL
jgi:hypothetical protein